MVEGESGFLNVCPPWNRPVYEPSKRRLTWPCGAIATLYTGEEPDRLRGPEHDLAWADEVAAWKYAEKAWANLLMGLRLGDKPQAIITTTPRPIHIIRELLADCCPAGEVVSGKQARLTRGKTKDNMANLPPDFIRQILKRYEGTRLGAQELEGEILEAAEGALWTPAILEHGRITTEPEYRAGRFWVLNKKGVWIKLLRVVVGVDPATTTSRKSDETGIIVVGIGEDGNGYVLADYSCKKTPPEWSQQLLLACKTWGADCIVLETNRGGDLVEHTVRLAWGGEILPRIVTLNSQEDKFSRIEPYVGLYPDPEAQQKRSEETVHHVGHHKQLEDEQCTWVPAQTPQSPNRIDALGFALAELFPMPSLTPDAEGGNVAPPVNHYQPATPRRSVWR